MAVENTYHRGLHRWLVLVALYTLLVLIAGATVTSRDAGLSVPDWPLSYGKLMPKMEGGILYEHGHRMLAGLLGLSTIVSLVWIFRVERRQLVRKLAIAGLIAVLMQIALGGITVIWLLPWLISSSHASLAQLLFSTNVAMALFTSRRWLSEPDTIPEDAENPIRGLSLAAPICVLGQLFLGAMARHKAIGSIYHICGAPFVTGVVLWVSMRILLHYARNPELRTAAVVLITITLTQVFLGVGAFMTRIAYSDAPQPMPLMVTFTVLHVAVGALTLAASVVMAILVRRNLGERVAVSHSMAA